MLAAAAAISAAGLQEVHPTDLAFEERIHALEPFAADTSQFTQFSLASAGTFAITGGAGVVTLATGATRDRFAILNTAPGLGIAQGWVQVDVAATTGSPNTWNIGGVGWALDASNFIVGEHDARNNETRITVRLAGVSTTVLISHTISADYQLALSLYRNRLTVFVDAAMTETWTQVIQYDVPASVGDLTALDLSSWKPFVGASASNDATCTWTFDNLKATARLNPFCLAPPALDLFTELFTSDTGQFTTFADGTIGAFAVTGGQGVLSQAEAAARNIFVQRGADLDMPQWFASVDVVSVSGASGIVGLGIAKDANNYCVLDWNRGTNTLRWSVKLAGSFAQTATTAATLTPPFRLGYSAVLGSACAWVDRGKGWELLASAELAGVASMDFKTLALTGWKACVSHASSIICSETIDNWRFGRFGAVGLRDMTWVTQEDEKPYVDDGLAYFTGTSPDARGIAYMSLHSFDVETGEILQTGALLTTRSGATQPDLSGHVITDGTDCRLFTSSWGNGFGGTLEVLHAAAPAADLLHGSHLVAVSALNLPSTPVGGGEYDPMAVKIGSTWYLAYTVTDDTDFVSDPFYTAVASSADLSSWSQVGTPDSGNQGFEGTKIHRMSNGFFVYSGGHTSARAYALLTGAYAGDLDVTTRGGSSTFPHPAVSPLEYADGREQVFLSFDDTRFAGVAFTWGHVRIYEAPRFK